MPVQGPVVGSEIVATFRVSKGLAKDTAYSGSVLAQRNGQTKEPNRDNPEATITTGNEIGTTAETTATAKQPETTAKTKHS